MSRPTRLDGVCSNVVSEILPFGIRVGDGVASVLDKIAQRIINGAACAIMSAVECDRTTSKRESGTRESKVLVVGQFQSVSIS